MGAYMVVVAVLDAAQQQLDVVLSGLRHFDKDDKRKLDKDMMSGAS